MTQIRKADLVIYYDDGTVSTVSEIDIRKTREVYSGLPTGNIISRIVWMSQDEIVRTSKNEEETE